MHEYAYNPFRKSLTEVSGPDLIALRTAAEGWYIEYKQQSLPPRDLAKAMSAFANQYGGMLFIGVSESIDGSRTAGSFPGIEQSEIAALTLRLREASAAHVSPPVYYEEHIIRGPCAEIGLPAERSIVIAGVHQGADPPYVHSSGRIYRRIADQSTPKEETDRHVLDLLWERGRTYRSQVVRRLRRTPELLPAQDSSAWAFVYLVPDLRLPAPTELLAFETFRRFAKASGECISGVSVTLDAVYSRDHGFLGRHVAGNDPRFGTLTFHWWHDGVARLDIPLNTWASESFQSRTEYHHVVPFLETFHQQGHAGAEICDFTMLPLALAALANLDTHLRRASKDDRPLYAAIEVRNVLYRVPYLDSSKYLQRCKTDGVPVTTERVILLPEEPYFDTMLTLNKEILVGEDPGETAADVRAYFTAAVLAGSILRAVGIHPDPENLVADAEIWSNRGQPKPSPTATRA